VNGEIKTPAITTIPDPLSVVTENQKKTGGDQDRVSSRDNITVHR